MSGTITNKNINIADLLNKGVAAANSGNKAWARAYFQQVLEVDSYNETAILWLAYLSDDAAKAIPLLEGLLRRNPRNELARAYLEQARAKTSELEQLIAGSATLNTWNRMNKTVTTGVAVPKLGEYLLQQGRISQQQLDMAVRRQQDLSKRGHARQLGQVMVELGYISQYELEDWLNQQSGDYSYRFKD